MKTFYLRKGSANRSSPSLKPHLMPIHIPYSFQCVSFEFGKKVQQHPFFSLRYSSSLKFSKMNQLNFHRSTMSFCIHISLVYVIVNLFST